MGRAPSSSLKTLNFSSISFVLSLNPLKKIPVGNENIPMSSSAPLHMQTQNEHKQDLGFVMSALSMRAYPDFALVWDPRASLQLAWLVLFEQKSLQLVQLVSDLCINTLCFKINIDITSKTDGALSFPATEITG